jgi:hypothetical protein
VVVRLLLLTALALVAATTAAAPRQHTVDLATGRFDGHAVLGATPARVRTMLGTPSRTSGPSTRRVLAWLRPGGALAYEVIFAERGGREHAVTLALETGAFRDPRLGNLLVRKPRSLAAGVRTRYGDLYRLVRPLARTPGGVLVGEFEQRAGPLRVTFGAHGRLGTFLTLWDAAG